MDPDSDEAKNMISQSVSGTSSPTESPFNGLDEGEISPLATPSSPAFPSSPSLMSASSPISPISPSTPSSSSGIFRRGHGRQQSLGTTKTSPSTRRRSIESTISLIKEAVDGTGPPPPPEKDEIIESPASSPTKSPVNGTPRQQDPPPPPFSVPSVPIADPEDTVPSWG